MSRHRHSWGAAGAPSPEARTSDSEAPDRKVREVPRRRHATVFDAVAGRISTRDDVPLYTQTYESDSQIRAPRATRYPTHNAILAPEEVLFRRKNAPLRWPHYDIYMAHERDLPDEGREVLPPSDLLKAVHSYTGHFYDALGKGGRRKAHLVRGRNINERSMDETGLLALGILLEEAGREVLGARGDMVFTEEEVVPAETERPVCGQDDRVREGMANLGLSSASEVPSPQRGRKRRKVSSDGD